MLAALVLTACGGGSGNGSSSPPPPIAQPLGTLADTDATADAVNESARPGAAVGITVAAPELAARGAVSFALSNTSNGAFGINATTGVIRLVGNVDYEVAASRTVTARATSADGQYFSERDFTIGVIDSPAPTVEIDFPFPHANYAYATAGVSGRVIHPDPSSVDVRASAGSTSVLGVVAADGRGRRADDADGHGIACGQRRRHQVRHVVAHAGRDSRQVDDPGQRARSIPPRGSVQRDHRCGRT
jgi:hypothetical protein